MEIFLKHNMGFKWKKKNNITYKGVISDNQFIREGIDSEKSFLNMLKSNKRFSSIICDTSDYIYVAVDHLRMFPIFYGMKDKKAFLSDDALWIKEQVEDNNIDKLIKAEFIMTGYVTENKTLYQNIKQLQAGEYLVYEKKTKTINIKRHYNYKHRKINDYSKVSLINLLDEIHFQIFKRLIDFLGGRTAVLPLSAGYDSRVIAMMLKRLGYEKVICYTYGKPGNWESVVSKQIADELNYRWIFIPYTKGAWRNWIQENNTKEYFSVSGQLTSLPHIQDHLAVGELKNQGLIPEDSVFIPGHTAILSFSGYNPESKSIRDVSNNLFEKHYSLWNWSHKDTRGHKDDLKTKLENQLKNINSKEKNVADIFYQWELQERHAKFICNSVRAYEHYGYKWALPLWEKELIEFWISVPDKYKIGKELYKDYYTFKMSTKNCNVSRPNTQKEFKNVRNLKMIVKKCNVVYDALLMLKKIDGYRTHPLNWYYIISFHQFIKGISVGAENINSFIVNKYLSYIIN